MVPPVIVAEPFSPYEKESIKKFAESGNLASIPSHYNFSLSQSLRSTHDPVMFSEEIPIIDLSLLVSGTPDQRLAVVRDLGNACREWGFFMVVNHGVEERLRERVLGVCRAFFDLSEEEKGKYVGRNVLDPIRYGTSINKVVDKVFCWRDFIKVLAHPIFHSPDKPADFRDVSNEYCTRIRAVVKELIRGISESLGLGTCYLEKASGLETGVQVLIANFYPWCPQPELAMGAPPHFDQGLLTILMQNEVGGLQVKHNGEWVMVNPLPNSFLVNTGDQLEILSNGKYKSVLHRAVVNDQSERISVAIANGPSLGNPIAPAPQLVDNEHPLAYRTMKYSDYVALSGSVVNDSIRHGKSCLDLARDYENYDSSLESLDG